VTASSGHGILDRHVRATILSSWSFRPPGRETAVVKEFAFRLER
jgi:outer membrane biosynthesis protein TonB